MHVGISNPNLLAPVAKLKITNKTTGKDFSVLYNPTEYVQSRALTYSESPAIGANAASTQFISGTSDTLTMDLFFDTFSSGAEVGGSALDKAKFAGNSTLPSVGKLLDVRDYTSKVYDLMLVEPSAHVPPLLKLEWSSLQFEGYLVACSQRFTQFNEFGKPVRATLTCTFKQYLKPSEIAKEKPNGSPDTAKFRTVQQGDSLWAFAAREFGDSDMWREIAAANGITNPRLLNTGEIIEIPAL